MPQKNKNKVYQYPSFAVHTYMCEGGKDSSGSLYDKGAGLKKAQVPRPTPRLRPQSAGRDPPASGPGSGKLSVHSGLLASWLRTDSKWKSLL